ncbi:MAG: hypothetical protein MEQ07_08675 [Aquimonas sp.]|nr:hypothetical protein [Aquimonas sp.]
MTPQKRSRLMLILVAVAFGTPFITAVAMRFGGWQPGQTRNYGELVQPPLDWSAMPLRRMDGSAYSLDPLGRRWQLLVLPPTECAEDCREQADTLRRVWISEGRRADKLDVLWPGAWPDGLERFPGLREMDLPDALRAQVPVQPDPRQGLALALIDHNGFLVVTYAPGYEPGRMRRDLDRLVK